jgi:hypothetical protein
MYQGVVQKAHQKTFFGEGVIQVFSIRYWCNDQEGFLCLVHNAFFAVALFG